MKYCPYCGGLLAGAAASFCAECGKKLPSGTNKPKSRKEAPHQTQPKSRQKRASTKTKKKSKKFSPWDFLREKLKLDAPIEPFTFEDDGYDGYYDNTPTDDEGELSEGFDAALIKRIALIFGIAAAVIMLAILAMRYL